MINKIRVIVFQNNKIYIARKYNLIQLNKSIIEISNSKNQGLQYYLAVQLSISPIKYEMQLIFQNSKQLKQVRQFIKGLGYVYDSIQQKQKQIYLYISSNYIAIINSFMKTHVANFKVCFCKLKRNMYKLKNFFISNQNLQHQGVIFFLDVGLILKILNTQVQSDITQMVLIFPELQSTGQSQYEMKLTYEADGLKGAFKLFTRLQHSSWPFKQGIITQSFIQNSIVSSLLVFPSKFAKQIQYYKKFSQFWLCLGSDGVNIKRTQGNYVISDQLIRKDQFGDYEFYHLSQTLKGNVNLNINSDEFFHHLQQSNKQNRKTQSKLIIQQQYYHQQNVIKKCYILLITITEKKQLHELFQISARPTIDYSGIVRQVQRLKLRTKDPKKQQQGQDERVVLNRFYGPEYEQTMRMDMIMRQGFVRVEAKGQQSNTNNPRKYKVQL